jgi:hypothetical protein
VAEEVSIKSVESHVNRKVVCVFISKEERIVHEGGTKAGVRIP